MEREKHHKFSANSCAFCERSHEARLSRLRVSRVREARVRGVHGFDGHSRRPQRVPRGKWWSYVARQFPDGRTSEGMLAMLERLRALRAGGLDIFVTTFEPPSRSTPSESQTPYEVGTAESLREAFDSGAYDLAIVLVGGRRRLPAVGLAHRRPHVGKRYGRFPAPTAVG